MRLKMKQLVAIFCSLMMVMVFQNCGQPGAITANSLDKITGVPDLPPTDDPASYLDFSKNISVNQALDKADILVVIDNSGSMAYEQKNMADRFDTFLDQLSGLDWRVGITTTDVSSSTGAGKDGALLTYTGSSKTFVSKDDGFQMAKSLFSATIQRGEQGSGNEQGIFATYRALERSFIAGSANNAFFRSDAALSVIVVSDADETPGKGGLTLKNKEDELRKYVSQNFPSRPFKFHSIIVIPGDVNCLNTSSEVLNEGYGNTYNTLSQNTGGIVGSVCATDYGSQLKAIGQSTADLVKNVSLDCAPVDSDKDGKVDLKIVNLGNQVEITDYTVSGNQVRFAQPIPVGNYKVDYRCLK